MVISLKTCPEETQPCRAGLSSDPCRAIGFLPLGRLAAWTDLDKQGRFKELGIELTEARFSDSLFDVNAAYFFALFAAARTTK